LRFFDIFLNIKCIFQCFYWNFECIFWDSKCIFCSIYCTEFTVLIVSRIEIHVAYLTGIVSGLTTGAKAAGRKYEYLLGDRVYLADALRVADHRDLGLADAQWDRACFAHITVSGDRAPFSGRVADAPCWQAHQAHAIFELGLTVELEQGDVVVQRLRIVVVVDVRGGHPECLCTRAPVLSGQVMVAHAHVDRVTGPHNAEKSSGVNVTFIVDLSW